MKKLILGLVFACSACVGQQPPGTDAGPVADEGEGEEVRPDPTPGNIDSACLYGDWYFVNDKQSADQDTGRALAENIAAYCKLSNNPSVLMNDDQMVNDDGQIQVNHHVIVSAGGPYVNRVTKYSEQYSVYYFLSDDSITGNYIKGKDSVQSIDMTQVTPYNDTLLMQVTTDPQANLIITAYGIGSDGTRATVDYFVDHGLGEYALIKYENATYSVIDSK